MRYKDKNINLMFYEDLKVMSTHREKRDLERIDTRRNKSYDSLVIKSKKTNL